MCTCTPPKRGSLLPKRTWSLCQKCRWWVTANHTTYLYTLCQWELTLWVMLHEDIGCLHRTRATECFPDAVLYQTIHIRVTWLHVFSSLACAILSVMNFAVSIIISLRIHVNEKPVIVFLPCYFLLNIAKRSQHTGWPVCWYYTLATALHWTNRVKQLSISIDTSPLLPWGHTNGSGLPVLWIAVCEGQDYPE